MRSWWQRRPVTPSASGRRHHRQLGAEHVVRVHGRGHAHRGGAKRQPLHRPASGLPARRCRAAFLGRTCAVRALRTSTDLHGELGTDSAGIGIRLIHLSSHLRPVRRREVTTIGRSVLRGLSISLACIDLGEWCILPSAPSKPRSALSREVLVTTTAAPLVACLTLSSPNTRRPPTPDADAPLAARGPQPAWLSLASGQFRWIPAHNNFRPKPQASISLSPEGNCYDSPLLGITSCRFVVHCDVGKAHDSHRDASGVLKTPQRFPSFEPDRPLI